MKRPMPIDPGFDAATANLTATELGALLRLARFYWLDGELPAGVESRARIAGVTAASMQAMTATLAPYFAAGGLVPIARHVALAKTARRAKAGRASAVARWGAGSVQPAA